MLDFNSLGDGAVIEIEGVKFEFDSDGIQNDPDASIVDISSGDFDDIALNFETTLFDELNGIGFEMSIFRRSGSLYCLTIDNDGTTMPESDKPDITATSGPGVPGVGIMIQAGCNSGNCIEVNILVISYMERIRPILSSMVILIQPRNGLQITEEFVSSSWMR